MKQEKFSLLYNFHQVLLLNQLHLPPWKKLTMRTLMPGLLLVRTLWKPKMFRKKLLTKQIPLRLQFQQLQVRIQTIRPLYDVKWVLFKWVFCYVKVLPYLYPSDMYNHYQNLSNEALYGISSQDLSEIPVIKLLTFPIYLIKEVFLGIIDFDFWYLRCPLR